MDETSTESAQGSHPIAVEVGQLLHLITFVDPAIYWDDGHGYEPLANAIRVLSDGISFA